MPYCDALLLFCWFNLSSTADNNIATALNGYTAPILGIISIILIYLAYTGQTEANVELKRQNNSIQEQNDSLKEQKEIELIISMLTQLDNELAKVSCLNNVPIGDKLTQTPVTYTGYNALLILTNDIHLMQYFELNKHYVFSQFSDGRIFISLANSFKLLVDLATSGNINNSIKTILNTKLENYYNAWLSIPFARIRNKLKKFQEMNDDASKIIEDLANKYDPIFDIQEYLDNL